MWVFGCVSVWDIRSREHIRKLIREHVSEHISEYIKEHLRAILLNFTVYCLKAFWLRQEPKESRCHLCVHDIIQKNIEKEASREYKHPWACFIFL